MKESHSIIPLWSVHDLFKFPQIIDVVNPQWHIKCANHSVLFMSECQDSKIKVQKDLCEWKGKISLDLHMDRGPYRKI